MFYIFDKIENNHHELHKYNPTTSNMIIERNARLSENYGMEAN